MVRNAMMICVSCKGWTLPKHILCETDAKPNELIDQIAQRAFESYKEKQKEDGLYMLDYNYYGNVEIFR